tara:strand:- start:177 stop:797 length:621 start_codon:yes stop_codon:yes gene_type:complete
METLAMVTTIIVALITAVLGPVVVAWVKDKLERKSKSTPVGEALESSTLISEQLDEMMQELGCDRVWVAQFHNGGHFYPTGKSIQKFSVFYEKCNPSIPHIQSTFQNIPVSLFPKVLSKVYKDGELEILNVDTEESSFGIAALTNQFKTKSICMVGLKSLDGNLIGVMGISFIDERNLVTDDWIIIRQKVGVIGTLLSKYLYKQKS